MDGNVVTITKNKENILEFELTIQGLNSNDPDVYLIVETQTVELSFPCAKQNDKWVATIPELNILEYTAYPFKIAVVADGYYFEPFRGSLNVVKSSELYVTKPENITLAPRKREEPKEPDEEDKSETKPEPKIEIIKQIPKTSEKTEEESKEETEEKQKEKSEEKPKEKSEEKTKEKSKEKSKEEKEMKTIKEIADRITSSSYSPSRPISTVRPIINSKDESVNRVLDELGIQVSVKPKRRFSLNG